MWCANASDGVITAHPSRRANHLQEIKGKKGYPFGKEIMENAADGQDQATDRLLAPPRHGDAAREDYVLYAGRRPELWGRLLQGMTGAAFDSAQPRVHRVPRKVPSRAASRRPANSLPSRRGGRAGAHGGRHARPASSPHASTPEATVPQRERRRTR